MKNFYFMVFFTSKSKITTWTVQIHYNLQNHRTFKSGERLVNLLKKSALLVYDLTVLVKSLLCFRRGAPWDCLISEALKIFGILGLWSRMFQERCSVMGLFGLALRTDSLRSGKFPGFQVHN